MICLVWNLPHQNIFDFITGDFEDAWNSLAINGNARSRGNFMFARQTMTLLEFASRLCFGHPIELSDFSRELSNIEPRYFISLSGINLHFKGFALPSMSTNPGHELLWLIFDLVRNGQAHQYQQIVAILTNQRPLMIQHCGADHTKHLSFPVATVRQNEHLKYHLDQAGNLTLHICPHVMYLDIKEAIIRSGILGRIQGFSYLSRRSSRNNYNISSLSLASDFASGGLSSF